MFLYRQEVYCGRLKWTGYVYIGGFRTRKHNIHVQPEISVYHEWNIQRDDFISHEKVHRDINNALSVGGFFHPQNTNKHQTTFPYKNLYGHLQT